MKLKGRSLLKETDLTAGERAGDAARARQSMEPVATGLIVGRGANTTSRSASSDDSGRSWPDIHCDGVVPGGGTDATLAGGR